MLAKRGELWGPGQEGRRYKEKHETKLSTKVRVVSIPEGTEEDKDSTLI